MFIANLPNWISAGSALIAAALWFWSARVRIPATITTGWGGTGGTAQTLADNLRKQSRLSALAAVAAGIAALAQAWSQVLPPTY